MNVITDTLYALQRCIQTGLTAGPSLNELRAAVPGPILAHFDRQIAQGKKGLAEVRNGVCLGCHLRLPAAVNYAGRAADDLHVCENCGAYLMFPAFEPAAAPAPAKARRRPRAVAVA